MSRVPYTPREYANMHLIYGECHTSARAAAKLYKERYPNARHPAHGIFVSVHQAYSEGRMPGQRDVSMKELGQLPDYKKKDSILNEIKSDSTLSVRSIARRTGSTTTTVARILKRHRDESDSDE